MDVIIFFVSLPAQKYSLTLEVRDYLVSTTLEVREYKLPQKVLLSI